MNDNSQSFFTETLLRCPKCSAEWTVMRFIPGIGKEGRKPFHNQELAEEKRCRCMSMGLIVKEGDCCQVGSLVIGDERPE